MKNPNWVLFCVNCIETRSSLRAAKEKLVCILIKFVLRKFSLRNIANRCWASLWLVGSATMERANWSKFNRRTSRSYSAKCLPGAVPEDIFWSVWHNFFRFLCIFWQKICAFDRRQRVSSRTTSRWWRISMWRALSCRRCAQMKTRQTWKKTWISSTLNTTKSKDQSDRKSVTYTRHSGIHPLM